MIVMFSARRLKPGAWEQFRRKWDPGDAMPPGLQRAYHARNIRDEDEVISFGLFDMTEDDYRRWRADADAAENQRVDQLSAFVENEHVSGVYEVVDTVDPSTGGSSCCRGAGPAASPEIVSGVVRTGRCDVASHDEAVARLGAGAGERAGQAGAAPRPGELQWRSSQT